MPKERANWIVNMEEQQKTFLNSSGLKEEKNNHGPTCSDHGPKVTPLDIHGSPWRTAKPWRTPVWRDE